MVQDSNSYYGAKELDVDNVVFVHGSIDPWHAMGRTTDLNEDAPAIMIQGKIEKIFVILYLIGNIILCILAFYNSLIGDLFSYRNVSLCRHVFKQEKRPTSTD